MATSLTRFQFLWRVPPTVTEAISMTTHTLFIYEGPDWCLEELQTESGAVLRSWSYELVETGNDEEGGCVYWREIVSRSQDWVGSCLLRTVQLPCQLMKEDEKGVWVRMGGWDRVQWHTRDCAAAAAWRLLPAATAAATATATSTAKVATARPTATTAAAKPFRSNYKSSRGAVGAAAPAANSCLIRIPCSF